MGFFELKIERKNLAMSSMESVTGLPTSEPKNPQKEAMDVEQVAQFSPDVVKEKDFVILEVNNSTHVIAQVSRTG